VEGEVRLIMAAKKQTEEEDLLAARLAHMLQISKEQAHQEILTRPLTFPVKQGANMLHISTLPGRYLTSTPKKCRVMIIQVKPTIREIGSGKVFTDEHSREVTKILEKNGIDLDEIYVTSAIKFPYPTPKAGPPRVEWSRWSTPYLWEEIDIVDPEVIFIMGANAIKVLFGNGRTLGEFQSTIQEVGGRKIFATVDPLSGKTDRFVSLNRESIELDISRLASYLKGELDSDPVEVDYRFAYDYPTFEKSITEIISGGFSDIAIDCEWSGPNPLDGELRTIQICWAPGKVLVGVFHGQHRVKYDLSKPDQWESAWKSIAKLIERPETKLIGHFIRADLPWIVNNGVNVVRAVLKGWDTSLAGHILDNTVPNSLTDCTLRHTNMGKYDLPLETYKKENKLKKRIEEIGYELLPDEILLPYAAKDADATFRIYKSQLKEFEKPEMAKRLELMRFTSMPSTLPILEIEATGLPLDQERLKHAAEVYTEKLNELLAKIRDELNWPTFEFGSSDNKAEALFSWFKPNKDGVRISKAPPGAKLRQYTPVISTSKVPWDRLVRKGEEDRHRPSTDKDTLLTLGVTNKDVLLDLFLHATAVNQICNSFTGVASRGEDGELTVKGGLLQKLWSDGRVHCSINQMVDTGRYSHRNPNLAQIPKSAEDLIHIVFEGQDVPSIRSCFPAPPGWVFIDNDWTSAEMFVLAWLSGDTVMEGLLTKPNTCFHSETAIKTFNLDPVPLDWDKGPKAWLAENDWSRYRSIQKTINFGIVYSREGPAIQREVYKEGIHITVDEAVDAINSFKQQFPKAIAFLEGNRAKAIQQGYVETAFNRVRIFPKTADFAEEAGYGRKGMNTPIQGAVGDLMSRTLFLLWYYREILHPHLRYKIALTIHDQIILLAPIDQLEECVEASRSCMEEHAKIPGIDKHLKAEPEINLRWGEPLTKEQCEKHGIPLKYAA